MPIKLCDTKPPATKRIMELRKTVKNGEGLTMSEVADDLGCSVVQASNICRSRGLAIKTCLPGCRGEYLLLVNETDYKKYAGKSQS
jgi:hypothetical protein